MSETLPIVFCEKCGSHYVDINGWFDGKAQFECAECDNRAKIRGFTIGRTRNGTPQQLAEARKDRAQDRSKSRIISREVSPGTFELAKGGQYLGKLRDVAMMED